LTESWIFFKYS